MRSFAKALPDTRVFYAVKANPAPEILDLLARLGSCFDCRVAWSRSSRRWPPARRPTASASATRSRRSATSRAPIALGVRLFAVDCEAEVEKIARAAPGAKVFCRILCDGAGAEWPLSRKFGCAPEMAASVLERAHRARPRRAWPVVPCRLAAAQPAHVGRRAEGLGGDLPRSRRARHRTVDAQPRRRLSDALSEGRAGGEGLRPHDLPRAAPHFGNRIPETIIEPGRGMVGNAGDHRGRGGADLEEGGRATRSAGSISTSASSTASPRPWTR